MRKAISDILKDCADVCLVGEATSFREVIALASQLHPDVILLDIHMPDGQQVPATELDSSLASSRVVGISLSITPETKTLASAFGAITLLDKTKLLDELPPWLMLLSQVQTMRKPITPPK